MYSTYQNELKDIMGEAYNPDWNLLTNLVTLTQGQTKEEQTHLIEAWLANPEDPACKAKLASKSVN